MEATGLRHRVQRAVNLNDSDMRVCPRLLPTMNRFLVSGFFGPFLVCLAAFTAAYMIGDLAEHLDELFRQRGFGLLGFEYLLFKLPLMISQLLPAACLTGVLLGFALLNRSGEVLACQQLGVSRLQMAVPVLLAASLISLFEFALSELVVPFTTRESRYLYQVEIKGRKLAGIFANRQIWVRVHEGFFRADSYDVRRQRLLGVTLFRVGPDYDLHEIVQAENAVWDGHVWSAMPVATIIPKKQGGIGPSGDTTARAVHFGEQVEPGDLSLLQLEPEEFSLWELNRYIDQFHRVGLDPGRYVVDRDLKYALPFSCLIMVALGLSLSLDPLPRASTFGRSLGFAIAIGTSYWIAMGLASSLGGSGVMPAWIAAWLPDFTFGAIAVAIFLLGEER